MMRKLVTVRKVSDINPIPGADSIEVATVEGWKVVVPKGKFKINDPCVYMEIDTFLPEGDDRWDFLISKSWREYNGIRGHVLKTIKLRGQISQGYIDTIDNFPEIKRIINYDYFSEETRNTDFSDIIGVSKYEPPVNAKIVGMIRGTFPSFIRKTDSERAQNLLQDIFINNEHSTYEVTLKLDGTSFTCYKFDDDHGVCSRNLNLYLDKEKDNIKLYYNSNLYEILQNLSMNVAIQGELMGPGIQGNREKFNTLKLFIFNIFDINRHRYYTPAERSEFIKTMYDHGLDHNMVKHVPILYKDVKLKDLNIENIQDLIEFSKGPSINNKIREGLVFKNTKNDFNFKIINNDYLLKS